MTKRTDDKKKGRGGKRRRAAIIAGAAIVIAAVVGAGLYMRMETRADKEFDEYLYAIGSSEPMILQSYLDRFTDAPRAHRDTVTARLKAVNDTEREWLDLSRSGSAADLRVFIDKHSSTKHRREALHLIDSLDFESSRAEDTEEAYNAYLAAHYDGDYYEEAQDGLKRLKLKTVTGEEQLMVYNVFGSFFSSITERDEVRLTSLAAERLMLLDKSDATRDDLIDLLHKLYKDNVELITWEMQGDEVIKKREIGDRSYEYSVVFTVKSVTLLTDGSEKQNTLRVNATVNPDGLISSLRLTRLME